MTRALWKGPFVDPSLIKKVEQQKTKGTSAPIKTWSRKSTIIPEFIGTVVPFVFCCSTFLIKLGSTNGPFQTERDIN